MRRGGKGMGREVMFDCTAHDISDQVGGGVGRRIHTMVGHNGWAIIISNEVPFSTLADVFRYVEGVVSGFPFEEASRYCHKTTSGIYCRAPSVAVRAQSKKMQRVRSSPPALINLNLFANKNIERTDFRFSIPEFLVLDFGFRLFGFSTFPNFRSFDIPISRFFHQSYRSVFFSLFLFGFSMSFL